MSHMVEGRCLGRIDRRSEELYSVVVKETFLVQGETLVPAEEPEPILEGEAETRAFVEGGAEVPVRLPDLVPNKAAPDLVVLAMARSAPAVTARDIVLEVGDLARRTYKVQGQRRVLGSGANLRFSDPEPFEEVPLTWEQAYGGVDQGYPLPNADTVEELITAAMWHPGTYPRNSLGKGFMVAGSEAPPDGTPLPCVEYPDDLLTPARLVCPTLTSWHLQPLPASPGWQQGEWFPRCAHLATMPGPWPDLQAGPVTEETLGYLADGFTGAMRRVERETYAALERMMRGEDIGDAEQIGADMMQPGYFQEAAPGLSLPGLEAVERVTLHGLDNGDPVGVTLPRQRPRVSLKLPGGEVEPPMRLLTLLIDLEEGKVLRIWAAPTLASAPALAGISEEDLPAVPIRLEYR